MTTKSSRGDLRQLTTVLLALALLVAVVALTRGPVWGSPPAAIANSSETTAPATAPAASDAMPPPPPGVDHYTPNVNSGGAPNPTETTVTPPPVDEEAFTPTPEAVRQAVDRSNLGAYRYAVQLDVAGLGAGTPLVTGAADGERVSMHLDVLAGVTGSVGLAELLELLPSDVADVATVDLVVDDETLYVTTPLFKTLLGVVPSSAWGKVDVQGLGVLTDLASTLNGSRNFNPGVILKLLRRVDLVTDLGSDTLDGTAVQGIAADLNVGDVLSAQGLSPAVLGQAAVLAEATFRVEAWVDDEGLIREIKLYLGQDSAIKKMRGAGLDDEELVDLGLKAGIVVDFEDHGDPGIKVDIPADAQDLTAVFDRLPQLSEVVPVGA